MDVARMGRGMRYFYDIYLPFFERVRGVMFKKYCISETVKLFLKKFSKNISHHFVFEKLPIVLHLFIFPSPNNNLENFWT